MRSISVFTALTLIVANQSLAFSWTSNSLKHHNNHNQNQPNIPPTEEPPPPSQPSTISSPLGSPRRHTTTHDPSTGLAVFLPSTPSLPTTLPPYGSIGMVVHDAYATFTTPPNMTDPFSSPQSDLSLLISNAPRMVPNPGVWFPAPGETLVRYCDWAPGATLDLHRTETIDFGVVMQGEMDMFLDSGEVRRLKVGDTLVQRGTLHRWKNPSETEWARVVFFLIGTEPVVVAGEKKGAVLPWAGK